MLFRKADGSFQPAGKNRKEFVGDLWDGVKPSWLTEHPGGGVFNYAPGVNGLPGVASYTLEGTTANPAPTTVGGWRGPVIDLTNPRIKSVWWTADDLGFSRPNTGVYFSAEFGIRSVDAANFGASIMTNYGPPEFPLMRIFKNNAVAQNDEVRFPWGPRVFESAASPLRLGDNPRPMTFHIDNRDGTVSLLSGDQVVYSRQHDSFTRGLVRPVLNLAVTGSDRVTKRSVNVENAFRLAIEFD